MKEMKQKFRPGDKTHLGNLLKGQTCKVIHLSLSDKALRRRLLDMGITEGVHIKIKKIAPLGDPIDLELRGYQLCLRKRDMTSIDVEVIS
jgi:ferrous iron transport protein A